MARFIVLDIVFKASSLNYDLGGPTYHELKKITRWNARVHTYVSRYALRYSILETGERMGLWSLAPASKLKRARGTERGEKGPIQPSMELLYSGEILEYPEFDLFGYMITEPETNIRESPVKINPAISLTPFFFDKQFSANIGLARRMMRKEGKMSPSPIHIEEHEAFYVYSVVIDVDRIGKVECLIDDKNKLSLDEEKYYVNRQDLPGKKCVVVYGFKDRDKIKERIKNLVRAILNAKRNIKGRAEDLSPILLVVGIYNNTMYDTYKDRIELVHFEREYVEEIEEKEEDGKLIRIVRRKSTLSDKPEFVIYGLKDKIEEAKELAEDDVLAFIDEVFKAKDELKKIKVYYRPPAKVDLK